jgi:hypothetical protein
VSDKARLSKALQALRVIQTWADFPGTLDPAQVKSLIERTSREIGGLHDTAKEPTK